MATAAEIRARIDAASTAYATDFAGKNRAQCDIARLDVLLADMRAVVTLLERRLGPMRPVEKELLGRARKQVELFARERAAITEAKSRRPFTPEEQVLVDLGARGKAANGILRRAFDPGAKHIDLAALFEVAEEMDTLERDMLAAMPKQRTTWMVEGLQAVRMDIEVCRQQHLRIVEAWSTGPTEARREFLHALASDAIAIAADEDQEIPSDVRRPARRRHGAAAMRLIAERIRALGSLTGADADLVLELGDRAEAMELEVPIPTVAALSRELETVNNLYRANFARKPREEVSLPLLRRICTRGASVTLQAFDAARGERDDATAKLLRRARELLSIYDGEFDAVSQAQKK